MPRSMLVTLLMVVLTEFGTFGAPDRFVPASYVSGALPAAPVLAVSGGEVFLEVTVANDGHVESIRTLRTTPPFTDAVIAAVRGWRFAPANTGQPVASPVLVAATFTPPALDGPTQGQPPEDVGVPTDGTPMVTAATPALYPPRAVGTGTVLVEVTIDFASVVTAARIVVSSPAFDAAAVAAAKSWSFTDAFRNGDAVTTHAYLLFGFQQPLVGR
jgi:TonB family protein